MAEIHYIRGSTAPKVTEDQALENAPALTSGAAFGPEAGLNCAYNETRQNFVATNVDVADGADGAAETRLHTMEPGSGLALWISPFRGISPSCARFPLDLVFLDKDSTVVETVEFFPMSVGGEASARAASILVLAADSLAQVQVKAGDRLTIAARQEMMHRLPRPKDTEQREARSAAQVPAQNAEGVSQEGPDDLNGKYRVNGTRPENGKGPVKDLSPALEDYGMNAAPPAEIKVTLGTREPMAAANGNGRVAAPATAVHSSDRSEAPIPATDNWTPGAMPRATPNPAPIPIAAIETAAGEALQVAQRSERQPWKKDETPRTWLERLLLGDNPDPRRFPRKSTSELVAYFFTGGTPMQHPVRDISNSGLFIVTHERWFHGTIVQMTLSESHRRKDAPSISLYAKVMRSGRDGVGLKFVLEGIDRRNAGRYDIYEPTNGIRAAQVNEFVDQLKAS